MFDSGPCDWLGLPLLLPTPTTQFSLDHKRRSRKRNRKKWKRSNRPFAGSSHMVRNKLHWDANDTVGLPKQRNSYQSSVTFLCFESPTASFASQCNLFRTMRPDPANGLFFRLRFRRAYDSAYYSDIRFSLGHKLSYDSDSASVASENQP